MCGRTQISSNHATQGAKKVDEIFAPAIDKIMNEMESQLPEVPAELRRDYGDAGSWGGAAAGASAGASSRQPASMTDGTMQSLSMKLSVLLSN
jgi:hypothetical protein